MLIYKQELPMDTMMPIKVTLPFSSAAIGTGHDWGDTLTQDHYIGTVMICGGSLVLHYFIVDPTDKTDKSGQEVGRMYDILEAMQQTDDEDEDEDDEDDAEDDND